MLNEFAAPLSSQLLTLEDAMLAAMLTLISIAAVGVLLTCVYIVRECGALGRERLQTKC